MPCRILIFVVSIVYGWPLLAQDTIYFDLNKIRVTDKATAQFVEVVLYDQADSEKVTVREYLPGFIPSSENHYSRYSKRTKNGRCLEWYKNGSIKSMVDYSEGVFNGERITYWKNGRLKRKETIEMDSVKKGEYFDSLGNAIPFYPYLKMPVFPGGQKGLSKFLAKNLTYPTAAVRKADEGIVYLSFIVGREGRVDDVNVMKGISKELDEEAIRVIKLMPAWEPGVLDGEYVKVRFSLPIKFDSQLTEKQKEKRRNQI